LNFITASTLSHNVSDEWGDDDDMFRTAALLITPLVTLGLVYWFGFLALIGCIALVFCVIWFSSGSKNVMAGRPENVDTQIAGPTTFMAGL
jgi:hypothetical protein